MPTKFASQKLDITMKDSQRFTLWFDGNGKVTVGNGTFENPAVNSFSLVQVVDCPFATPTCISVCYVHRLEKAEEEIHRKYCHNSATMRAIVANPNYRENTRTAMSEWILRHALKGFRWHVSGDIFSMEYSEYIGDVCRLTPDVFFWIYTRSFPYLGPIIDISNLVVNLSADKDNFEEALEIHQTHGLRICYLTVDDTLPPLPDGSVIFPSHELRGRDLPEPKQAPWWQGLTPKQRKMVCPPDFFGQSELLRCGPCKKCLVR